MKKSVLIIIAFLLSTALFSQEIPKYREVGLMFNDLDNFGIQYKIGKGQNAWRMSLLNINVAHSDSEFDDSDNREDYIDSFGFRFKLGREKKINIDEKMQMILGGDLSFTYSYKKDGTEGSNSFDVYKKHTKYSPGINFVLGFNYILKEKFVLGAELSPGLYYSTSNAVFHQEGQDDTEQDTSSIRFNLSNNTAKLTVGYRF